MAGLNKDRNGYRIRFYDKNGDRQQVRLPGLNKAKANSVCAHITELNAAHIAGLPVSPATLVWLSKVGEIIHQKLVAVGLCDSREAEKRTLAETIDYHITRGRTKTGNPVSAGTIRKWKVARGHLVQYFEQTPIGQIRVEDAEVFREWLGAKTLKSGRPFKENNIRTVIASAKMFFNAAMRRNWVTENPFAFEIAAIEALKDRSFYVSRDVSQQIFNACPDAQWRLMFALWRLTGLRKMEVFDLRWEHVLWDQRLMVVPCAKTAHHIGASERLVPIVEILQHLKAVSEVASEGVPEVISRYSKPLTNLDKPFKQIVLKAGVPLWPKPFQNLRASCETDWLDWVGPNGERNSSHVVASWVGHSIKVQNKHYAQVDHHHFATFNDAVAKVAPPVAPKITAHVKNTDKNA